MTSSCAFERRGAALFPSTTPLWQLHGGFGGLVGWWGAFVFELYTGERVGSRETGSDLLPYFCT